MRVNSSSSSKSFVLLLLAKVSLSSGLFNKLLKFRHLSVILVGTAHDLSNLLKSQSLCSSLLEQQRRYAHVSEADRSELEILLQHLNVTHDVQGLDVLESFSGEGLGSLTKGQPGKVVRTHFQSLRNSETMVNRYKLANSDAVNLFRINQDIANVAIKVENSHVEYSNFVDFVG